MLDHFDEYFELSEELDEWNRREGAGLTGAEGQEPVGVDGLEFLRLRTEEKGLVPLLTFS